MTRSGGSIRRREAAATTFLYDGDELVLEYDGSGIVQKRYVHGTRADDPLIMFVDAGTAEAGRRLLFASR